ncbi:MAG: glycosyltransferase [Planctomycetaceae bacterium]
MMKIVLLIPTLDRSGAEKQFTLLATGLPKSEFSVSVMLLTRSGPYEADLRAADIPVTNLQKRWKFDPVAFRKLKRVLREVQPDIMHSWLFAGNAYGRLAVGGGAGRPKVVISERCVDSWKSGWQHWVDRRLQSRTDQLIANSESVADFYRERGFPEEKISVIHNGIAVGEMGSQNREAVLHEFGIPAEANVVGYVGRLARQKRVTDLVWAMQLLQQLRNNVYFLIVGDGPERAAAEQLARHMRCDHLIRFVGQRDDVSQLIHAMDVFWLASDFEGQSNSLMEAMAAGVPVVASDIPPNRELVVDGETGFLVKPGDSVGFAQFADRILADPDLAKKLGAAGRSRMQTEFSVQQMIDAHVALYRRISGAG